MLTHGDVDECRSMRKARIKAFHSLVEETGVEKERVEHSMFQEYTEEVFGKAYTD